jgi:PAS domain S-box-containing protein
LLEEFQRELQARQIDVDALFAEELLEVIGFSDRGLSDEEFDTSAYIQRLQSSVEKSIEEGYETVRVVVYLDIKDGANKPLKKIMYFEAGLDYLRQNNACSILCIYNRDVVPAGVLRDIVCAHPQLIDSDRLCENLWYVPAAHNNEERELRFLDRVIRSMPYRVPDSNESSSLPDDNENECANEEPACLPAPPEISLPRPVCWPLSEQQLSAIDESPHLHFGISRFTLDGNRQLEHVDGFRCPCSDLKNDTEAQGVEQQLVSRLHSLLNVNMALTETTSVDELCQKAIELGREQLGYDRMSIWLLTDNPDEVRGTYGVDEQGNLRDERHMQHKLSMMESIIIALLPERLYFLRHNTALYNDQCIQVGTGTLAYASIWDGRKQLGYLFVDNLVSRRPITRQDGELLALLASAIGHLYGRKCTEEQLRIRDRALESSLVAFALADQDRYVTYVNPRCLQVFGYSSPEEVVGRKGTEFWADKKAAAKVGDEIRTKGHWSGEILARRKDGSAFETLVSAGLVNDEHGQPIGIVGSILDISERKQVERELDRHRHRLEELVERRTRQLEQSREKIRQAERLASIGTLASGIAHEINNPVGSILLSAQIGREAQHKETDERKLVDKSFQRIIDNARRCGRIVQSVLKFARQEDTERWPQQVNDVLDQALKMIDQYARRRDVAFKTHYAEGLPLVQMNPLEMEQVFVNLLKNAIESGPAGSVRVTLRSEKTERGVRILVEDNGSGIHEQQRKHLFDPFFTTRQQEGGTGLGLSIAHGIVTNHGGKISVANSSDGGSTFIVELPKAPITEAEAQNVQNTDCG